MKHADPLVGKYFLVFKEGEDYRIRRTGLVKGVVDEKHRYKTNPLHSKLYLVEVYDEWFLMSDFFNSTQHIFSVDEMVDWSFYDTIREMAIVARGVNGEDSAVRMNNLRLEGKL